MLCFSHSRAQSLALSLYSARSSALHCCSSRGHLSECSMACGSVPHSQVTSSVSRYPHFLRVTFERPTPDLNLLRHFHSAQLESAPGGSTSLALMDMVVVVGRSSSLSSHKAALVFSALLGSTSLRKLFLDLSPSLCRFMAE